MRVTHVVPSISNEANGPSYSIVRLCESQIAQGANVRLLADDRATMSSRLYFLKTFPPGLGPRQLGRSPYLYRWLQEEAVHHGFDVIHNHSLWMMSNVYPGIVARKFKIPMVVSPRGTLSEWAMQHGSSIKKIFWPLVQQPSLTATSCFHATAESEYEDIRRLGFRQPVAIIPNGIDIPDLPAKKRDKLRTLLFLGRIHSKKGLDLLLPAWKALQDRYPEWRLRIVGPDNGGYLAKMQRLADDLRLRRVEFSGPLFGIDKHIAYRQADLYVLPTYSENFGMTVAEAMAAGTPAIVSKGAPWKGLNDNGAGWWIEIGLDPLVACLEDALGRSVDDLQDMGMRSRSWMERAYAWPQIGRQMNEAYSWILQGGRKPECIITE